MKVWTKVRSVLSGKMGYVVVFLVTLVIALTHDGDFPRFLLGFELLLAAALYVCARMLGSRVNVKFQLPVPADKRSETVAVEAEAVNGSILPVADMKVEFSCEDLFSGERRTVSAPVMIDGRGRAIVRFRLNAEHCGVIRIIPGGAWVKDYLGLFQRRCSMSPIQQEYTVLPDWTGVDADRKKAWQKFDGERETDTEHKGEDYSEIHDIRPYRKGDAKHSIHWKLSAKMDDIMVREAGDTSETAVLIFLDLYVSDRKNMDRDVLDRFYEKAASLSWKMMTAGVRHYVVWADFEASDRVMEEKAGIVRYCVRDEASFRAMLLALIHAPLHEQRTDLDILYKEQYADEAFREAGRLSVTAAEGRKRGKTEEDRKQENRKQEDRKQHVRQQRKESRHPGRR